MKEEIKKEAVKLLRKQQIGPISSNCSHVSSYNPQSPFPPGHQQYSYLQAAQQAPIQALTPARRRPRARRPPPRRRPSTSMGNLPLPP